MNSEGVNEGVLIKIFMWWWKISKMDKKKIKYEEVWSICYEICLNNFILFIF